MMNSEGASILERGAKAWQEPFEQALNEPNEQKLGELVLRAETAIYQRFEELQNCASHMEELRLIKSATEQLLSLKVNRLGWPPVK